MKIQRIALWLSFSIFMGLVSSCAQSTGSVPTSVLPAPATRTESPTLTPVAAQTLFPSPIVVPTLSVSDARERLLDVLANNGGCALPCLWGITPGKSTYQEAEAILLPLSAISVLTSFMPEGGAIFPIYTDGDLMLNTNVGFSIDLLSDHQTVNGVHLQAREVKKVDGEFVDIFDTPFFKQHLNYYMLPSILTEYGTPTTVMLSTMANLPSSGVPGGFKILLLYPDQGIFVNYTMQMQIAGESIMGCPSSAHIELKLFPFGHSETFFDLLARSGWTQIIQNTYKPIDEATSLTKEEFYLIFSEQTDECVLTPANLWPIPS